MSGQGPGPSTSARGTNSARIDVKSKHKPSKTLTTQEKYYEGLRKFSVRIIENQTIVNTLSVLTIWSLFSTDIRIAAAPKSGDIVFDVIMSIIFFVFIVEMFFTIIARPDYFEIPSFKAAPGETRFDMFRRILFSFGSFYFWLECLAIASLALEIQWMNSQTSVTLAAQTAGNTARVSARMGRQFRLTRTFSLVRIVRLVKYFLLSSSKNKLSPRDMLDQEIEEEQVSHVGAKMSDLTNQRVIILVLSMLIVIPSLTVTDSDLSNDLAARFVNRMAFLNVTNSSAYESGLNFALNNVIKTTPVMQIVFEHPTTTHVYYEDSLLSQLRDSELLVYRSSNDNPWFISQLTFNNRNNIVSIALYNIYTTIFVFFVLLFGTYFFSNDVNKLVIVPIERMVELVRQISANPLGVEYKMLGAADGFHEGLETTVLLSTITKIGGLMRVGFGEAGASVIAKNLAESSGGKLNLMGTGTMIDSIFGFCDIRNFTDTTECLQEEVMLFVNRIAHILHGIVVQCSGSANKNIGDAFLLTWKIERSLVGTPQASVLADKALLAFLKTLVELIRRENFICTFSQEASARLYKRFPGYNVRIGCGLHFGWAIEGAIGSNRKIDASYLSPNVNFTEFLESSTKIYDVPLLMSEPFFRMLSPAASRFCRQIDRIRRTEAEVPLGLYTYDADLSIDFADFTRKRKYAQQPRKSLKPPPRTITKRGTTENMKTDEDGNTIPMSGVSAQLQRAASGAIVTTTSHNKGAPEIIIPAYTQDIWETDDDLSELRHKVMNPEFRKKWPQGIGNYISGNWVEAAHCFRRTLELTNGTDGPSKFLLKIMGEYNFEAPEDWPGYRSEGIGH